MTTAGFVPGTHDEIGAASWCARGAALASLALGLALVALVPDLGAAAGYVAVLACATAATAIAGALRLWLRPTLVGWAVAGAAAATVLVVEALALVLGLPGTGGLPRLGAVGGLALSTLAALVLVLTVVAGMRRDTEPPPDQPYAL